jgi:hypothetical protein
MAATTRYCLDPAGESPRYTSRAACRRVAVGETASPVPG